MMQKKKTFIIVALMMVVILFLGCSKDQKDVLKFTYDSKDYNLNYGSIASIGATNHTPPTYEYDLLIAGPGIKYNTDSAKYLGKGNFIELTLYSAVSEFLKTGSYAYDGFESKDSLTFDYGVVGINYDLATETGDTLIQIKTGIAVVEKRGNIYKLNLNLFTKDDKRIEAYYAGFLENITLSK